MARIQPLSAAVAARLRAGPVAVDVPQCLEELLLNSLDAGATRVAIEVRYRFAAQVELHSPVVESRAMTAEESDLQHAQEYMLCRL